MIIVIILLWLFITFLEILRNWVIIEAKHRRPIYWWSNVLRIFTGFIFWVLTPLAEDITYWQWWGMVPMMLFTFWFCFDYGLNWLRGVKPFHYLNPKGSFLDRFQYNYPGTWPWFIFKLLLMVEGITLFVTGLDTAWMYIP